MLGVTVVLLLAAWPGIARGLGAPEDNPFIMIGDLWDAITSAASTAQLVLFVGAFLLIVLV